MCTLSHFSLIIFFSLYFSFPPPPPHVCQKEGVPHLRCVLAIVKAIYTLSELQEHKAIIDNQCVLSHTAPLFFFFLQNFPPHVSLVCLSTSPLSLPPSLAHSWKTHIHIHSLTQLSTPPSPHLSVYLSSLPLPCSLTEYTHTIHSLTLRKQDMYDTNNL